MREYMGRNSTNDNVEKAVQAIPMALAGLARLGGTVAARQGAKTALTLGAKAGAKAGAGAATRAGASTAASTVGSTAAKEGAKHGVSSAGSSSVGVLSPKTPLKPSAKPTEGIVSGSKVAPTEAATQQIAGEAATEGAEQAAGEAVEQAATEGAKEGGIMGHLMDPKNMAMHQVLNMTQMNQMKNQQEKMAHDQKTMESAQRGKEISTGTTTKSDYFGDWVLDEPMLKAWNVLKARMEVGPHDEQQDELFEHLKNLSGQHSIRANEKDNSFILDNVHDDDEDIARRLIESFGRKFADTEAKPEMPESNYF